GLIVRLMAWWPLADITCSASGTHTGRTHSAESRMRSLEASSLPIHLSFNVPFSYYRIDPIKESLIEAGFSNINVAVVKLYKEIPDVTRFARGLIHGNPLIDQIRTPGGVEPDQVVDALAQALRKEFGTDPGRAPLQAIVFSAARGE